MTHETALYRLFDAEDTLLYVGITRNVSTRFSAHRATQSWWPQVARHTVEWFTTRDDAEEAERRAIRDEAPLRNDVHSPWMAVTSKDGRLIAAPRPARPSLSNPQDVTPPRQVRVRNSAWETYAAICERLGRTRAEDINDHIRRMIRRHGTEEEKARLAEADAEVRERRVRKYSGLRSQQRKTT